MANGTAVAEVVEEVEEVTAEPSKRGRRKGQELIGHNTVFTSKEEAEKNVPFYQKEIKTKVKVKVKNEKTGKEEEVEQEKITYEKVEEVDDAFRIYQIKVGVDDKDQPIKDLDLNEFIGVNNFVWARNGDLSLAQFTGQFARAELTDAKERGRARKIDKFYYMFFDMLQSQGKVPELLNNLKSENLMHYLPYLGLTETGEKTERTPLPTVAA